MPKPPTEDTGAPPQDTKVAAQNPTDRAATEEQASGSVITPIQTAEQQAETEMDVGVAASIPRTSAAPAATEMVADGLLREAATPHQPTNTGADSATRPAPFVTTWPELIAFIFSGLMLLVLCSGVFYLISNAARGTPLEVIARSSREKSDDSAGTSASGSNWTIDGRVLDGGENVADATVWAVVTDKGGQQFAPNPTRSSQDGTFLIKFSARKGDGDLAPDFMHSEAIVQARKPEEKRSWVAREGRTKISMDGTVLPSSLEHDTAIVSLSLIVGWFALSFVLAVVAPTFRGHGMIKLCYYLSVLATFLFSLVIIMAFYLAIGALVKDPLATKGEVVSLGFVNIFKGNFLDADQEDLIVSLSSSPIAKISEMPAPPAKSDGPVTDTVSGESKTPASGIRPAPTHRKVLTGGFGAPLWVIVLSVLGASLLTVTMLLQEIESPIDFSSGDSQALRTRIRNVVQQQVFILFAPLGGIFLYQGLLVAEAAKQPLAVALAALGAGVTLNLLLARAVDAASNVLNRNAARAETQPQTPSSQTPPPRTP